MDDPSTSRDGGAPRDPAEDLLIECLEASPGERRRRLGALRTSHPDHGPRVETLLRLLDDFGFLEDPAESRRGLPERIGDFRILRLLGSGGMGTVYLAEQTALGRHVALKVIHPHLTHSPRARERFRREALAASRLDHPAICTVYEVGEAEDVPFIAMRFVRGTTLEDRIRAAGVAGRSEVDLPTENGHSGIDAVLRHVETLARALHVAHTAGLVHRDVKPGNVMVVPDGEPVLLDFGLAVIAEEEGNRLTLSGDHVGTPIYMAPEQVTNTPADNRTDVYALGVLLYECLTLGPPFEAVSRESLFQKILREEPSNPCRRNPAIGRDLGIVLQTALAKEPDRRYGTTGALADDLARVRRRESIAARPAGSLLRLRRFGQRHPAAAVLLVGLAIGLIVVALLFAEVRSSRDRTDDLVRAVRVRESAQADPLAALPEALEIYGRTQESTTLSALYQAVAASQELQRFEHDEVVWRTVFSADSRLVASCSDDHTARVWDTRGEQPAKTLPHKGPVVDIDTDGTRLVTASLDGKAHLWSYDGERLGTAPLPDSTGMKKSARFSHDGKSVLVTSLDGLAWIWDIESDGLTELSGHSGRIWQAMFSPDDQLALTLVGFGSQLPADSRDFTARVWRRDGSCVATLNHTRPLLCADFSPAGDLILTGSHERRVRLWTASGDLVNEFTGFSDGVRCVRFHPDGKRFAAADLDGHVRVFALNGNLVTAFAHDGGVWNLEFSQDGKQILTASWDKTARLHDLRGRLLRTFRGHSDRVLDATFSPRGDWIATASYDRTVRLWRASDREFPVHFGHTDRVPTIAFANRTEFVSGSWDGTARICGARGEWELDVGFRVNRVAVSPSGEWIGTARDDHVFAVWSMSGALRKSVPLRDRQVGPGLSAWRNATIAFLGEARLLAGAQDSSVGIFDAERGLVRELPIPIFEPGMEMLDLAVHPDGELFVSGHWGGAVIVRSLDGRVLDQKSEHDDWVVSVQFSPWPDGSLLITGSSDGTAVLWRWTGGAELETVTQFKHEAAVTSTSFAPDGSMVLTTAKDGIARLWDLKGKQLYAIRTGPRALLCGAWSPDSSRIATGDDQGIVRTWPVQIGRILDLARERTRR